MSRKKSQTWVHRCGRKGVNRVAVFERTDAAAIYIEWFRAGKRKRRSLKNFLGRHVTDRAEAIGIAEYFSANIDLLHRSADISALFPVRRKVPRVEEVVAASLPLLTAHQLPVDALSGIYLMLHGDRVVYVGQSQDIMLRLYQHRRAASFRFDSVAFIEVPGHQRDEAERGLIRRFRPIGNTDFNPDKRTQYVPGEEGVLP